MSLAQPIPANFAQEGWYTAFFLSKAMGKSIRTVQRWCRYGFFAKRGIVTIKIQKSGPSKTREQYWIHLPEAKIRNDAMFRGVNLDIFSRLPVRCESEGAIQGDGATGVLQGPC